MRHLKISFLTIIALLSLGITAATNAGFFKTKKAITVPYCYTSLISLSPACVDVALNRNITTCEVAKNQIGEGVRIINTTTDNIECDEIEEVFCCAQLTLDPGPCAGQTPITFVDAVDGLLKINYAKIHAVYCQSKQFFQD